MEDSVSKLVIITGMSGAGKTIAVQSLEDLGFFCVDNLPPVLIPKFAELIEQSKGRIGKVALVIDMRGREFFYGSSGIFALLTGELHVNVRDFYSLMQRIQLSFSVTRKAAEDIRLPRMVLLWKGFIWNVKC